MHPKDPKYQWPHLEFPHTQEIYFDNGERRVLHNIIHVEQGKWVHIVSEDGHGGSETIVNPDRILFVRIVKHKEYESKRPKHLHSGTE